MFLSLSAHEQLQLFPAARAAADEQVTAAGRRSSITTFILTVLRTYNEFDLLLSVLGLS